MDCYVYYKVETQHADAAHAAVARLFDDIAREVGVRGRLQKRAEDPATGPATWMEHYRGVADNFVALLAVHVDASGLATLTAGPRHVECFVDVATGAPS